VAVPLPLAGHAQVFLRLRTLALAAIELAEAEVAVRGERAHPAWLGERQRLTVVAFSLVGAACRRDVAGEAEGVSLASPSPHPAGERQCLSGVARGLVDPARRSAARSGRSPGLTILLVEQNASMALELADRPYVLESGRVSLEGRASELARTDLVRKLISVREPSTGHGPFG
jgi:hypothetical protein